jgi:hypothetical protein
MTLTVIDTSAPVILVGVTNMTLSASNNCAALLPDLRGQIVAQDCSPFEISQDPVAGTELGVGTNLVTFMVTDTNGLSASTTALVTVVDETPPVFVLCATNRSLSAGTNCLLTLPDLTGELSVTDVCSFTLSQNPAPGTGLGLGELLITFTASDSSSNASTCTMTLTVIDASAPVILAGATNMSLSALSNCAALLPDLRGQIVAQHCSPFEISQDPVAGTHLGVGSNLVTFTVTDTNGLSASTTALVTVVDETPPVFLSCATNRSLSAGINCLQTLPDLTGELSVTDVCVFTLSQDPAPGTGLGLGEHLITFIASDASSNTITCTMNLTVIDTSAPVILAGATNMTLNASSNCAALLPDLRGQIVAQDCSPFEISQNPVAGTDLGVGTNLLTFTVTDTNGLSASTTAFVTVVDDTPPMFVLCVTNRSLGAGTNCLATLPDLTGELSVTDVCAFTLSQDPAPGTGLSLGEHVITFTASDASSNASTCTMTLTVIDTSAPVILAGATNMTLRVSSNCAALLPDLRGQIVAQDCSPFEISQNPVAGTELGVGTNLVTFTVTDTNGLSSGTTALVSVVDDTPPVFVLCATNRSLSADTNCLLTLPDLTGELSVTDACAFTLSQDPLPGTGLSLGEHLITFTASDASSNASTCTMTLIVIDTSAPVILVGATNLTLNALSNCAALLPDLRAQIVAQDCSPFEISQNPIAGTELGVGTNLVTFTVTDTNGLSASTTSLVSVVDDTPPVFVLCATNRTLSAGTNCLLTLPDLTGELSVTDMCAFTLSQDPLPGTGLSLGDHLITFTAHDASSNASTCTMTLKVIDTGAPVILAGATNMTLSASSNCAALLPDLRGQIVAQDCSPFEISQNPVAGTELGVGTNLVTFTVTDTNGFSAITTTLVTVVDDTPPVIVLCATNRTLSAGVNCLLTLPDLTGELSVTDVCAFTLSQSPTPGTGLGLGEHLITFTASDASSNASTCTMTLTVIDTSAPVILAGATNMTLSASSNCAALLPDLRGQIVAQDCSPFEISQNPVAGTDLGVGTNLVTFTVTDTNGLSATTTALVTVVDETPPVFVLCATNRSLSAGNNCLLTLPDLTAELSVTDVCTFTLSQDPAPGTGLSLGEHLITFTAIDASSNASTCTMTLTVIDTSAPVILAGATNMTLSASSNCAALLPDLRGQIVAEDCSPFEISQTPVAGTDLGVGTNLVIFTVTDTNGLSASTTALVTVVDDTPPVFVSCTTNRSLGAGTNCLLTLPDLTGELSVTDVCAFTLSQDPLPGTGLGLGEHLITFTASDAASNASTCTMTLVVIDTSAPVILAGATNMTLSASSNCVALLPDLRGQIVAQDCSPFEISQNPIAGTELSVGTNLVTFTVTDTNGFSASTSALVTVVDDTPPMIVLCATNRSLSAGTNCLLTLPDLTGELSVSNVCAFTLSQDPLPGTGLGLGEHLITFTASDASSNASTCTMTLTVIDTSAPVILVGATNMTLSASSNCAALLPDLRGQIAAQDCSPFEISQAPVAGTELAVGTNQVTFTVTDTNGLSSSTTALVIVVDDAPPVFVLCATNRSLSAGTGCLLTLPDLTSELSVTDACAFTLSQAPLPGTGLGLGEHLITFTASDASSNASTCTMTLTVIDTSAPVILAGTTNMTLSASSNCAALLPDLRGQILAQDCSPFDVSQNPIAGTELGVGTNLVTFTVTDTNGLIASTTALVTVVDDTPPAFLSCATNRSLSAGTNCLLTLPDLTGELSVTDVCVFTLSQDPAPGTALSLGEHVITFTASDASSNASTCTMTLTVIDTSAPVILAAATNMTLSALSNCAALLPDLRGQIVAQDCSPFDVSQNPIAGTELGVGTNLVTFTVTDTNGLIASTTALVTVVDDTPPVFVLCATNRSLSAGTNCLLTLPDLTGELSITDVCAFNISQDPLPGTGLSLGEHLITFTASDASSNASTCTVMLTVIDTSAPVILSGATNMTLSASSICAALLPDLRGQIVVQDCSPYAISQNPIDGTQLALGTNQVTFTVTDTNGLSSVTSTLVTVVDTTPPVFVLCATNRSLVATSDCVVTLPDLTGEISVTDACSSVVLSQNPAPGTELGVGVFTITFTASDAASNTSTCATTLSVNLPASANTNITISEFMAKNNTTIADEDGTHSDWIEIRNAGSCPLNLNGWALTDDATQLTKWLFPATNIAAGQYLVVWASSKNRRTPGNPLHTNFKVDDGGEFLALVQPDGTTIATQFAPTFPPQYSDISYGLPSDRPTNTFLAWPTPGAPNSPATNIIVVSCATNVTISEFMAKNTTSITDEDGAHSDWIEIHNGGTCSVNLNGWSLTDDATQLTKWRFPSTNIAAGQYLIVWASNKNRKNPGAPLHTNFKSAEEGEYLALVQPDGVTIATQFAPTFPLQFADVSYGLPSDRPTNTYLAWATPGAANSPATNFIVGDMRFHPGRGWYTNSVSVTIGAPSPGVVMYYTTNGTVPSPTNGYVYSAGLVFTKTTVLRAAAYLPGYIPSVAAHTYVFPDTVANQTGAGFPTTWGLDHFGQPVPAIYTCTSNVVNDPRWRSQIPAALLSIPTVSVAMSTDDMFGTNGLYSNTLGDGTIYERPCSVEYFIPASQTQFQINCGIQIQGSTVRDPLLTPKHNFRLLFKQIYGPSKLQFNLYPGSPVTEFDTLALHGSFNDHWIWLGARAQMLRDQWASDTQQETGGYGRHGTYVNLYINGLYWGMYDLGERPDASYAAHYLGGQASEYDALNSDELRDGSYDRWNELVALARKPGGITSANVWSNWCYYLDMPSFIDYLLINFYGANEDWPDHNYWTTGSVTNGVPFHFFSYDAEEIFLTLSKDSTGITLGSPGLFYSVLRQYPEFVRQFGDHANRLLFNDGVLTPERCAERWIRRAQEIDSGIIAESARWGFNVYPWVSGSYLTHDDWMVEQASLLTNWFPQRTDILISQLRNAGMYPMLDAPVLSPHSGIIVQSLPVTMSAPIGTIYYTTNGSDPRLPDGSVSPNAFIYGTALTLTNNIQLQARTFYTNTWSALTVADYQRSDDVELRISSITRRIDGAVKLDLVAWPGVSYSLLASTNIGSSTVLGLSPHWETIATLVPFSDGTMSFLDQAATNYPSRFYKLTWP